MHALLFLLLFTFPYIHAWSVGVHELYLNIALHLVNDDTYFRFKHLLSAHFPNILHVASHADDHSNEATRPLHYWNVKPDPVRHHPETGLGWKGEHHGEGMCDARGNLIVTPHLKGSCPEGRCLIYGLLTYTALADCKRNSVALQERSVVNIVHFLGDLHQMLHLAFAKRGGNDLGVVYDGEGTTLHMLYDYFIPVQLVKEVGSAREYVKKWTAILQNADGEYGAEKRREWTSCVEARDELPEVRSALASDSRGAAERMARRCIGQWIVQSLENNCRLGVWEGWTGTQDLRYGAYNEKAKKTVEQLIAQTSWRLKVYLENLFHGCPALPGQVVGTRSNVGSAHGGSQGPIMSVSAPKLTHATTSSTSSHSTSKASSVLPVPSRTLPTVMSMPPPRLTQIIPEDGPMDPRATRTVPKGPVSIQQPARNSGTLSHGDTVPGITSTPSTGPMPLRRLSWSQVVSTGAQPQGSPSSQHRRSSKGVPIPGLSINGPGASLVPSRQITMRGDVAPRHVPVRVGIPLESQRSVQQVPTGPVITGDDIYHRRGGRGSKTYIPKDTYTNPPF